MSIAARSLWLTLLYTTAACFSNPLTCLRQHIPAPKLFAPASKEYQQTVAIDNSRVQVAPLAVVMPTANEDVTAALIAAQACGVPFSVISGGHSAQGYGLIERGLTLSMRHLNSTRVWYKNGEPVLTVGAGARYREVYKATHAAGWLVPVGGDSHPSVRLLARSRPLSLTLTLLTLMHPDRCPNSTPYNLPQPNCSSPTVELSSLRRGLS